MIFLYILKLGNVFFYFNTNFRNYKKTTLSFETKSVFHFEPLMYSYIFNKC